MFHKPIDFLAIGDTATDAFIRLKDASVHCNVNMEKCELCMKFADKVPFESVHVVKAVGNSANASVSASRLGLSSALVSHLGSDQNGSDCLSALKKEGVSTRYIKTQKGKATNYHFVLWYEADRTILVNHVDYEYSLPSITPPKWVYLSSLANGTENYHNEIADWLMVNPTVKLAFQPGTFQMKLGTETLKKIYARTDAYIVNVEEAQRVLGKKETGLGKGGADKDGDSSKVNMLKEDMRALHALGPKIVLVTDGPRGAYMYDGDNFYYMPPYPDPAPPLERTGCGDAFASTFVACLCMGKPPLEALLWAPINPMSVAQHIGAQEGLLTHAQIEAFLHSAPHEYHPREI